MHVLFIWPNLNAEEGFSHGIACLSGALKARGHRTSLMNINEAFGPVPSQEEIIGRIGELRPDLIAFSVMSQQYRYALELARAIRGGGQETGAGGYATNGATEQVWATRWQRKAGLDGRAGLGADVGSESATDGAARWGAGEIGRVPIVIGGVHTIMRTQQVLEDGRAYGVWDYVGVGECDEALPVLVDRLERKDPAVLETPNFCIRLADGTYRRNAVGRYPDLNQLPAEDYEIFDLEPMLKQKNGWQSILTSRGCPYRCSYCLNHEVSDRYQAEGGQTRAAYLRRYEVKRIIPEVRSLKDRHPYIQMFIFDDDLFTLDEKYVVDFCKAYRDAGIATPFVVNAHVQSFTEPMAKALSEAPCMIVKFGLESGSPRQRSKILDRHMSNQQIIDAFGLCDAYHLHSSAFVMFGLPFETRAMMDETIDLCARIRPGRMRWAIFFPFAGTKAYEICRLGGLIDYRKMDAMDNYFVGSCLKFDPATELHVQKLQRVFHWHVNARAGWETAGEYQKLLDEVERIPAGEWAAAREEILKRDREISKGLLAGNQPHYSIRYTEVMAVHSDYVQAETGQAKDQAARRWVAFREQMLAAKGQKD